MTLAVIQTGGKQYQVSPGQTIKIEKLNLERPEDKEVQFTEVLLWSDGQKTLVGKPFVAGAKVIAEITGVGRREKIDVVKFKSKTGLRKKTGHRQPYTAIKIKAIEI